MLRSCRHSSQVCQGGQTAGVHFLTQRIQIAQIPVQLLAEATDGQLITDAPEANGGVVIILRDQLPHLADGVIAGFLSGQVLADIGNLRPNHHTGIITKVIEFLIMLIMGKANGICAHLPDQDHIFFMVL